MKYLLSFLLAAGLFIGISANAQTIPSVSPWFVNTANQITQRIASTTIKITGLSDGCLGLSSSILTSSGSACGSGSGGGGTISTSSPLSAGLLVQSTGPSTIANISTSSLGLLTTNVLEGNNLYFTGARAIASLLTGFVSGAGTLSASDSILTAIEKLDGNIAGKQPIGNYLTALTGDITASGPGSAVATLATVNSNVGSFTCASLTANAKGLITAVSNGSCSGGGGGSSPFIQTGVNIQNVSSSTAVGINVAPFYSNLEVQASSSAANPLGVWGSLGASQPFLNVLGSGNVGIGTSTPSNGLDIVNNSLNNGQGVLNVVGTLNSADVNQQGAQITITGAGTGTVGSNFALNASLQAGYTGSVQSAALTFTNQSAGTGADFTGVAYNAGAAGQARGTTVGDNVGLQGIARGGNVNVGTNGRAVIAKNGAVNIGIYGNALNTGTTPINVGGYFVLSSTKPTFNQSAALIADNGAVAAPIFVARDNTNPMFVIADGGNVGIGTTSPLAKLDVYGIAGASPFRVSSSTNAAMFEINQAGAALFNNQAGTSGFVLQSFGAGAAPQWVATSTLGLGGGGGAVSSVSNADGTLTISPTTGAVVASLALAHANTWTGLQQFNANASTTALTVSGNSYHSTASLSNFSAFGTTTPAFSNGTGTGQLAQIVAVGGTPGNRTGAYSESGSDPAIMAIAGGETGGSGVDSMGLYAYSNGLSSFSAASSFGVYAENRGATSLSTAINAAIYAKQDSTATAAQPNYALYSNGGYNYFNGNVGIATTSPSAPLSVSSVAQQAGSIPLVAVSSTTQASLFTVLGNGNVGIGVANPLKPLHVFGNTSNGIALFERSSTGNTGGVTTFLMQADSTGVAQNGFGPSFDFYVNSNATSTLGSKIAFIQASLDNGSLTTGDLNFYVQNAGVQTNPMNILYNGKIGIGTTTPNATLDLYGVAGNTDIFDISSSSKTRLVTVTSAGRFGISTSTPSGTALSTNGTNFMAGLTASASVQTGILCLSAQNEVINESVTCVASAARYKTNIASTTFSIDGLMKLQPISFDWKKSYLAGNTDPNLTGTQYSLIADDVQKVFPQLVAVTSATTTFEGKEIPAGSVQGLEDSNHWVSATVSWLQQIVTRQDNQQTQIDELKAEVQVLQKDKVMSCNLY